MNLRKLIRETLEEQLNKTLVLKENVEVSDELQYHIDNGLTLTDNVFRVYSEKYFDLVNEVRELYNQGKIKLNEEDQLMVESDLGKKVKIGKEYIYLDAPFIYETETEEDILSEAKHRGKNVKLNKPFRTPGGPKKFAVYVKTPGGGVKKLLLETRDLELRTQIKRPQNHLGLVINVPKRKIEQLPDIGVALLVVMPNNWDYPRQTLGNGKRN